MNQMLNSNLDVIFHLTLFHQTSSDRDHFQSFSYLKACEEIKDGEVGIVVPGKLGVI